MSKVEQIVYGWLAHLIADWFLQNDWMAVNKVNPRHSAGYVHAGIHTLIQIPILGFKRALVVGVLHWLIDLRTALTKWKQIFGQTTEGPLAVHVAIWEDQVAHLTVIATMAPSHGLRRDDS